MLRLFVTRHGETVLNTQRKLQGWKDSDLTENGYWGQTLGTVARNAVLNIGVRPLIR